MGLCEGGGGAVAGARGRDDVTGRSGAEWSGGCAGLDGVFLGVVSSWRVLLASHA